MQWRTQWRAVSRIAWVTFVACIFLIGLAWFAGDYVGTIIFYEPGLSLDSPFVSRAQTVTLVLLTVIFALAYLLTITLVAFVRRGKPAFSEEMISDIMLSREQFRMLYDSSPIPYFLMDDVGNIRNPNRATLRFFGGTAEDLLLTNFYSLLSDDQFKPEEISMLRTKVEHAVPITKEEMCIVTPRGESVWALASIYSLDRSSPIPFKHLVTLVDVTKEKESEQIKTDFLLLASHQLRTPLTTIKWYIDYLLSSKSLNVSPGVREYLEQIYMGNERMIELITTLLTVSRIEMGTLAPEFLKLQVSALVQDLLNELKPDIDKKHVVVTVDIGPDDTITSDRTMIRIALHNLLTNAIKYSPDGSTIRVIATFSAIEGVITVADNGHGIPRAEQQKIFTKLFRASNARKISANGTGLGLYLTKAFVEKLGGTIEFSSEEGKGTTFIISLPRVAPGAGGGYAFPTQR